MLRPRTLIILVLLSLAVVGAFRLRIDVEVLNVLPSGDPIALGIAEYQKHFLNAGELLVVLQSEHTQTNLEAALGIFRAATNAPALVKTIYWKPPANDSIESSAQFLAYLWLNSPTQAVQALHQSVTPENLPHTLAEARRRIATSLTPADMIILPRDPLGLHRAAESSGSALDSPDRLFVSEDGRVRILYLYAATPLDTYEDCRGWVRQVRGLIHGALLQAGVQDQVRYSLTGRPVFVDEVASGMKADMSTAVPGTLLAIAVLFYLLHRELRSLFILLGTLVLVLAWAALAGAAFLGELNVISIGFASILLGLAEDFGIVLHQERILHPQASAEEIRAIAGPGILWSALTTASAFALLNLSSLPGLRALGTLISLGILIGAWAMMFIFLPLIIRFGRPGKGSRAHRGGKSLPPRISLVLTSILLLASAIMIFQKTPSFNASPDALRPRESEASGALKIVQDQIGAGDPAWLLVHGRSAEQVRASLKQLDDHLASNQEALGISSFTLPLEIWPDIPAQNSNLPLLQQIASRREPIAQEILTNGFTSEALDLMDAAFAEWQTFTPGSISLPRGRMAEWVVPKFIAHTETNFIALGLIDPLPNLKTAEVVPETLKSEVLLSAWRLLGPNVARKVRREIPLISACVALTVVFALWLTFRSATRVFASLAVIAFSAVLLLGIMGLAGWQWNLINLTALPLLLGMGIDYSIHILTTLDRLNQNAQAAFQSVGRALLLAGSTSIAGFFFLSFSSNAGLASLGRVCALGLTLLLLTSVFLLPAWMSYLVEKPRAE